MPRAMRTAAQMEKLRFIDHLQWTEIARIADCSPTYAEDEVWGLRYSRARYWDWSPEKSVQYAKGNIKQ